MLMIFLVKVATCHHSVNLVATNVIVDAFLASFNKIVYFDLSFHDMYKSFKLSITCKNIAQEI